MIYASARGTHHPHGRGGLILVLSRKAGESVVIDGGIRITVAALHDGRVKIGVEAPRHLRVDRGEVVGERAAAERADRELVGAGR